MLHIALNYLLIFVTVLYAPDLETECQQISTREVCNTLKISKCRCYTCSSQIKTMPLVGFAVHGDAIDYINGSSGMQDPQCKLAGGGT
jgi:hypothetical protein